MSSVSGVIEVVVALYVCLFSQVMRLFCIALGAICCVNASTLSMLVKTVKMSRQYTSLTENGDVADILAMVAPPLAVPDALKDKLAASVRATHRTFNTHKALLKTLRKIDISKWKGPLEGYHAEMTGTVIDLLRITNPSKVAVFSEKTRVSESSWKKAIRSIFGNAEGSTYKLNSIISITGGLKELMILEIEDSNRSLTSELVAYMKHHYEVSLHRISQMLKQTCYRHELLSRDALGQFESAAIQRGKNPGSAAVNRKAVSRLIKYDTSAALVTAESLRDSLIANLGEHVLSGLWTNRFESGEQFSNYLFDLDQDYKDACASQQEASEAVGPLFNSLIVTRDSTKWCFASPLKSRLSILQAESDKYRDIMTEYHSFFVSSSRSFCRLSDELLKCH